LGGFAANNWHGASVLFSRLKSYSPSTHGYKSHGI
jgi:hypothetical protein